MLGLKKKFWALWGRINSVNRLHPILRWRHHCGLNLLQQIPLHPHPKESDSGSLRLPGEDLGVVRWGSIRWKNNSKITQKTGPVSRRVGEQPGELRESSPPCCLPTGCSRGPASRRHWPSPSVQGGCTVCKISVRHVHSASFRIVARPEPLLLPRPPVAFLKLLLLSSSGALRSRGLFFAPGSAAVAAAGLAPVLFLLSEQRSASGVRVTGRLSQPEMQQLMGLGSIVFPGGQTWALVRPGETPECGHRFRLLCWICETFFRDGLKSVPSLCDSFVYFLLGFLHLPEYPTNNKMQATEWVFSF